MAVCVDRPLLSLDRPFTYDLDAELEAGVGSLVEVGFHGRRVRGWVLGPAEEVPSRMLPVRRRLSAPRHFDEGLLALLRWVSARYVAPLASVIARAIPPRVAGEEDDAAVGSAARRRPDEGGSGAGPPADSVLVAYRRGRSLLAALRGGAGSYLLRPAPEDEVAAAVEAVATALAAGRRAVVLVPEADPVPATARAVVEAFGDRAVLFLGGSRRERYRTWLDVSSGAYDVVVGTRPAIFAPLSDLGLVLISRESHAGHREERSPYYHVRDVALSRARIEGAVCLMSALFPSTEAAAAGADEVAPASRRWPPVEVVRPGPEGRATRLVGALRSARRAFLYEPLPGYGIAAVCRACGSPAACASCGGMLRSERSAIQCVVCEARGRCAACGSNAFGIRRGGVERVEEWASRVAAVPVARGVVVPGEKRVRVGGPEAVKDVGPVGLELVGILDADLAARRPGMSALERSLATWVEAAAWASPAGRVIVQSAHANEPAVQALVAGRPDRFHRAEFERRAAAGFPVGAPVFRVTGAAELAAELERLAPLTLLVTRREGETVCLLALEPDRLEAFGRLARDLASRDVLARVEAEPHL